MNYRVRVSVEDDRFVTYLNGSLIGGVLTDNRLRRGGVGFFADDEDSQEVAWVDVSERDSFLGRMLAHFSLFVVPGRQPSVRFGVGRTPWSGYAGPISRPGGRLRTRGPPHQARRKMK